MEAHIRKNKVKNIIDNIMNVHDDGILDIYNIVTGSIKTKHKICNQRVDQIKFIEDNMRYFDDNIITEIDNKINAIVLNEETDDQAMKRISLKIINDIFTVLGKDKIKRFRRF